VDIYTKKVFGVLSKAKDKTPKRHKHKMTYAEELEEYTASVKYASSSCMLISNVLV